MHFRRIAQDLCESLNLIVIDRVYTCLQEVDLSQAPPFTLADLKNAIPSHCFKRKPGRSMAYLIRDVAVVLGMAVAAHTVNAWWVLRADGCLRV